MKIISLTQGHHALVDDEDYDRVIKAGPWHASTDKRKGRPVRVEARHTDYTEGKWKHTKLHRFILSVTNPSVQIDHEDGDPLNNQKHNLRRATQAQNQHNTPKRKNNTSGYKGVSWDKYKLKWTARIRCNGVYINLGNFTRKEDAANAYEQEATNKHGQFRYVGQASAAINILSARK